MENSREIRPGKTRWMEGKFRERRTFRLFRAFLRCSMCVGVFLRVFMCVLRRQFVWYSGRMFGSKVGIFEKFMFGLVLINRGKNKLRPCRDVIL